MMELTWLVTLQETDEDIIKNIAEHIRLELAKKQILHESSKVDEYLTVSHHPWEDLSRAAG